MKQLWLSIQKWFASKGGFAHVVASVWAGAVIAYASVPAFANVVNGIYKDMPTWAHEALLAVIGLATWYKNTQKGINPPSGS